MGEGGFALGGVESDFHGNKRKYIYSRRQHFCMYKKSAPGASMAPALVVRSERQPWFFDAVSAVAIWAGRAGAAALACMRALPRPVGVVLANPSTIFASEVCRHANRSAPACVSFT